MTRRYFVSCAVRGRLMLPECRRIRTSRSPSRWTAPSRAATADPHVAVFRAAQRFIEKAALHQRLPSGRRPCRENGCENQVAAEYFTRFFGCEALPGEFRAVTVHVASPAGDDRKIVRKPRESFRRPLQKPGQPLVVGVEKANVIKTGVADAGVARGGQPRRWIDKRSVPDRYTCAVTSRVLSVEPSVHHDDFERWTGLAKPRS